jgi:hypothetical protein
LTDKDELRERGNSMKDKTEKRVTERQIKRETETVIEIIKTLRKNIQTEIDIRWKERNRER